MLVEPGLRLAIAVVLLAVVGVGVATYARLGLGRAIGTAAVRAVVQLAVVASVIALVLKHDALALVFVALMLTVASLTCARRISRDPSAGWAALALATGALPVLALVFGLQVVPFGGAGIVAVSGIVIGGTMTAAAQAGRRALDELSTRAGEYEAALAIGLSRREAGLEICRERAAQALIPPLDQTRTVGLVTLPGAFIGVLLGGGSASAAGAAQVLVLVALVTSETIAVIVVLELIVRGVVSGPPPGSARLPIYVPTRLAAIRARRGTP